MKTSITNNVKSMLNRLLDDKLLFCEGDVHTRDYCNIVMLVVRMVMWTTTTTTTVITTTTTIIIIINSINIIENNIDNNYSAHLQTCCY